MICLTYNQILHPDYIIQIMIDLDQLCPDWQFAARHSKANMVGAAPSLMNTDRTATSQICPCCFQYMYKEPVPLCVNTKQLEFLGFGFPLFYAFLKNCIILLLVTICSSSALSLKKAIDGNYELCNSNNPSVYLRLLQQSQSQQSFNISNYHRLMQAQVKCTSFMILISRTQKDVSSQQQVIRIASFVIQLLFLIYMRDHVTKLEHYYDQRNTSLSDYALMLKNIPKQKYIQEKLREFFKKEFQNSHQIKQITLLPEYVEIQQLKRDRDKVLNLLRSAYDKNQVDFDDQDLQNMQNLIKIDQAIAQQVSASQQLAANDQLQCQKVILVFNRDQDKSQILDQFKDITFAGRGPYFGIGCQNITIKEAPQPKQILWKNVNVETSKKPCLYILSWTLSMVTLAIVAVIFFLILQKKSLNLMFALQELQIDGDNTKSRNDYNGAIALVFVMLFLVVIFNKTVMASLFFKFTELQKHQTTSKFQFSFQLKYLLGLFFTTALMTLAVQAVRFSNYYTHQYGVIQQQTVMFFLNAFFTPLFWLLNPFSIIKRIKIWMNYGKKSFTQGQANQLMQQIHYNIGKRYAEVIQVIWFTFLYITLIPIGAIVSVFGLIFYFWVDKHTLLRKSSLGGEVSGKIVTKSMKLLDCTLLLKAIGQILFDIQVRNHSVCVPSIVMAAVSLIYLFLPIDYLINLVNPQDFKPEQKSYDQVKNKFKDNYHTCHPVYKRIIADKLYNKMQKKCLSFSQTINNTENSMLGNQEDSYQRSPKLRQKDYRMRSSTHQNQQKKRKLSGSTILSRRGMLSPKKVQTNNS